MEMGILFVSCDESGGREEGREGRKESKNLNEHSKYAQSSRLIGALLFFSYYTPNNNIPFGLGWTVSGQLMRAQLCVSERR